GQTVQMKMACDARSSRAAQIQAEVHAVGFIEGFECSFDALRELHHVGNRSRIECGELRRVLVRNNHQMTRSVRILIQDYERADSAMDNESLFVVLPFSRIAENAIGEVVRSSVCDVTIPPGRPEIVHAVPRA